MVVGSSPTRGASAIDVEFTWSGLTLTGTLHLPQSQPPHPAVLMMQGSGPADRDNDVLFPPIRDAFLRVGVATYSFDKPGVGGSSGDWRQYALEARADQAIAALNTLSAHTDLDPGRIGVFGHSQGGWLAQMLASRFPGLCFAVANSGPSIGVDSQDLYGCEHTMRVQGHDEAEIEAALAFLEMLHDQAASGTDYETLESEWLGLARRQPWYGYIPIDDAGDWEHMSLLINEQYEPVRELARVQCPFLAVYGGLDVLVPAWQSARETGQALRASPSNDVAIAVFPEGDHRIQRDGAFVSGYLDLVASWVERVTSS